MRIFLSYASERRAVAEAVAVELRAQGHSVFLDRDDLPPGQTYDLRIRRAIEGADLFLALISPESVAEGRYTRTELAIARGRWPRPAGRVLPVVIAPTPPDAWPSYLRSLTVLEPGSDVVAEIALDVKRLQRSRRPSWLLRRAAAVLAAGLLIGAAVYFLARAQRPAGGARGEAEFALYGLPQAPTWGETFTVQLENVRPQVLASYGCRAELLEEAINVARVELDEECRTIRVTMAEGPFVDGEGRAYERLGSQRLEGVLIEVTDPSGAVAWAAELKIPVSNVASWQHLALAGLPPPPPRLTLNREYSLPLGRDYEGRIEHAEWPLGDGFRCSPSRSPYTTTSDVLELGPAGECTFRVRSPARRAGSRTLRRVTDVVVSHPASGWSAKLDLVFVFDSTGQ